MYGAIIIGASSEAKCTISNPSFITSIQLGLFSLKYKCLSSDIFFDTAIKASCPRRSSAPFIGLLKVQVTELCQTRPPSSDYLISSHPIIQLSDHPIIRSSNPLIILSLIAPSFLPLPSGASRWPLLYRVEKYFIFSSGSSPPERFRVFSHIIILPHHVCF